MSFRKRTPASTPVPTLQDASNNATQPLPTGVRPSATSSSPITSWGFRSIDVALGGGLPLGSMTVVLEDHPTAYHLPLCSYVTAQGIQAGHAVAVVSFDSPAERLMRRLPACMNNHAHRIEGIGLRQQQPETTDMKIAWRYQKNSASAAQVVSGGSARSFAYDFDLSQSAPVPTNAPVSLLGRGISESLDDVLHQIRAHLEKSAERKLLGRIVVHGLSAAHSHKAASPSEAISSFLSRIKAFTRFFGAVAVVSCAADVSHRIAVVASDATLKIDSFGGRGAGVAGLGKEWLGVLIVKKSYRAGRLPSLRGTGDVWVFKRGRRKYVMERATAAPDDEDPVEVPPILDSQSTRKDSGSLRKRVAVNTGLCSSRPDDSGIEF